MSTFNISHSSDINITVNETKPEPEPEQIWFPIPDYPNYEINKNDAVVRNVKKDKILKNILNKGYFIISLYKNGKMKPSYIHRILAEVFIPNPENKKRVDHIDRNPLNNNLNNLRWCSLSENQMNKTSSGKFGKGVDFHKKSNKFRAQIKKEGKTTHLGLYKTESEAKYAYEIGATKLYKEFAHFDETDLDSDVERNIIEKVMDYL